MPDINVSCPELDAGYIDVICSTSIRYIETE